MDKHSDTASTSVRLREPPREARSMCPGCGQRGSRVADRTVKALLSRSLRDVATSPYRYCRTRDCPVVYFSSTDGSVFTVDDVRERVYHKDPEAAGVWLCYCFRHTVRAVRAADMATGAAILADIRAGIAAGQCACDLRNPQGTCCLGNVQAELRHGMTAEQAAPAPTGTDDHDADRP